MQQGATQMLPGIQDLLAKQLRVYDPTDASMANPVYPTRPEKTTAQSGASAPQGGFGITLPVTPEDQQAKLLKGW